MKQYSETEIDAFKEFVSIGIGRVADSLNLMLNSHIELGVTDMEVLAGSEVLNNSVKLPSTVFSVVRMDHRGTFDGTACMLLTKSNSLKLVKLILDDLEDDEMDGIKVGTIAEIGNIVLNSIMGMISNILEMELIFDVPKYYETDMKTLYREILSPGASEQIILKTGSRFLVRKKGVNGTITIFLSTYAFEELNIRIKQYLRNLLQ